METQRLEVAENNLETLNRGCIILLQQSGADLHQVTLACAVYSISLGWRWPCQQPAG